VLNGGETMTRRERRICIFKMLFQKEFYQVEEMESQGHLFLEETEELEEEKSIELSNYVNQVIECIPELDEKINAVAKGWKTSRMAKVDLTILRLAVYEIVHDENVPDKVAINEAVEIAKIYGGNDSPSFINGILGKIVRGN
jgi:N utilization substance protein B